ncbi:MAG TPA: GWxTD domain-containing protein [Vicinamibacteria bacterium]|nr:GWxTD domain-containing protein [Vicinamibacteria bacterium]
MRSRIPLALALGLGLLPAPARADKPSKEEKAWADSVAPLMLQDEEKRYKDLKDKADRAEFQKIFWARRDPNLDTPENEYEPEYRQAAAEADRRFTAQGKKGSQTDCGRSFILLGEPAEAKKDTNQPTEGGGRAPETWTYKGANFQGGQAVISFDPGCMAGPNMRQQFDRVAENKVKHPNLEYRTGADGKLVKLQDQLPKPSPMQALLKAPRQDFPVAAQFSFVGVAGGGGTALLGLVRADGSALATGDQAGKKVASLTVGAQALDAGGKPAAFDEREEAGSVQADGAVLVSYRMVVKPGKYTVRSAVLDKGGKGSVAETAVDVPDLQTGDLVTQIMLLRNVEDIPENSVDPNHPMSGFSLAKTRLEPYFGTSLAKSDPLNIFFQYYGAKLDEASGKGSVNVTVTLLRGVRPIANAPEQPFDTAIGGSIVGPIPMESYQPGTYTARVRVNDLLAQKEVVKEINFELK